MSALGGGWEGRERTNNAVPQTAMLTSCRWQSRRAAAEGLKRGQVLDFMATTSAAMMAISQKRTPILVVRKLRAWTVRLGGRALPIDSFRRAARRYKNTKIKDKKDYNVVSIKQAFAGNMVQLTEKRMRP